ncbi:MAG: PTS sugar transporter subunit IIA [Syntrophobacteraceae bacterium]
MQLGVKDASSIFGVSEKTIFRWIKQKNLPAYLVNGEFRFNRAELLEWATACEVGLSSGIITESEEDVGRPPRLDDALRLGGIFHRVRGADKSSVLHEVVELMRLPREVDRDFLCEILLARETLGSTAIGEGIAIPHVRHPIVFHIEHPTITCCFLEHPLDFGAVDGRPVDILFTLVSSTVRAHQQLLSKLAFALKDPRFKAILARKGSCEELISEASRVEENIPPPGAGLPT